ncbi:MAG: fatty acid--CoA ligase family protein [Pseudomonadota bacterium]
MSRAASLGARVRTVLDTATGDALLFEDRWVSWETLAGQAASVSRALSDIPKGAAIAHVARNRPASVAALLALLADHRCVVQVSPIQPAASLAAELLRLAPAFVIAEAQDWSGEVRAAAETIGAVAIALEGGIAKRICDAGPRSMHPASTGDGDAAIMMPTSGTTGPPKRVPISFAQLETYRADRDDATPSSRAVIVAAPLFTVTGLRPLLAWATRPLRMAMMERVDVEQWAALVARYRPREGGLPPAAMRMLLESSVPRDSLKSLASWNTGSAPVYPDVADRFEAEFGLPVLVAYGATEFGGPVARMTIEDRTLWGSAKRGSSGRAIPGNELRIVDREDGTACPAGESGLLEVRAVRTGGDWVRTNDIAHIDGDGFLYIEGRADDVLIRGGFKVALQEVEALLETHPAIAQASVLAFPDPRLGEVPVAAIVLRGDAQYLDAQSIDDWARARLAPYKLPVRYAFVDTLPTTASMKINRVELRRMLGERL